ncbi:transcriptional regulator [Streptoalloteichus tenebrarius]|uniref:transcriptional regulator n=1 Tax=Streptoalloteichus tenebrarius (strain ATCC 17920 / DSM 40477 / JCM 4838 / CBS 697.72 / NBRC 16177 / NCIMB 11028 / NRRL B-12390 / A12253. 1 / ISP 5477) TaxID=1933 RepID=UPI0035584498
MIRPRFDELIHAPNRLQVCAVLAAVGSAEFATVRDTVGLSDSALSKHVKLLQEAKRARPPGQPFPRCGSGRRAESGDHRHHDEHPCEHAPNALAAMVVGTSGVPGERTW